MMTLELSAKIARIPDYPAAARYGRAEQIAMLASNESPYPPIPEVREAIERAISGINRYPDPRSSALRSKLSERCGVQEGRIAIGNGSCDILLAAGEALLEPGAEVIYAWPSFSVYPHLAAASGARAIAVPTDEEDRHDLEAMAEEITVATRLVLICNPNNPTSTALPLAQIAGFLQQVPYEVCVILDEAYCEYNLLDDPDASIELLEEHPNLVLLRTFSKAYGLCGLRVGYALCGSEDLPRAVDKVRQPFFCNAIAEAAATEALNHQDVVAERVTATIAERISVDERLRALGLQPADSQANFCWFELAGPISGGRAERSEQELAQAGRREAATVEGLAGRGILVRAGTSLGRPGALRVTYGTREEDELFLDALASLL